MTTAGRGKCSVVLAKGGGGRAGEGGGGAGRVRGVSGSAQPGGNPPAGSSQAGGDICR